MNGLLRDAAGNVLPLAAVGLIVSAALVGGGIDMGRAYRAEARLQAACDSAVLAGRRAVGSNGFDTTARTQAVTYFNTNFDNDRQDAHTTLFNPTTDDNGQTIKGTASTKVDTAVMKIFGVQKFDLSVECEASMGVGNSDVVMVLDTTGSMSTSLGSQTRIQALRAAMKNFYDTVHTATVGTNARIRYGFVPYSSSVNVGRLLDDDWLRDSYSVQSREANWQMATTSTNSSSSSTSNGPDVLYSSTQYNNLNSCNNNLPTPTTGAWGNNGSATSTTTVTQSTTPKSQTIQSVQPERRQIYVCRQVSNKYVRYYYYQYRTTTTTTYQSDQFSSWNYHQINYPQFATYKTFQPVSVRVGSNGAAVSSTWAGCIEERKSSPQAAFSFSTVAGGITPYTWDLDIDEAPDPADPDTSWAPMWPELAYYRTSGGNLTSATSTTSGSKASSYCPVQAQLMEEMDESAFDAYADSLQAQGSTYLDIGMIWGARLASPEGLFADNVNETPDNGGEVSRHIIFMTDGIMEPSISIQSSYGIEWHDRRVTSDGSSNQTARHSSRFRAVCDAIKAKGIRIWVIAFTSGLSSDLTYCASDDSSYNANSATELNEAFQEIAKQVGELRVTQ